MKISGKFIISLFLLLTSAQCSMDSIHPVWFFLPWLFHSPEAELSPAAMPVPSDPDPEEESSDPVRIVSTSKYLNLDAYSLQITSDQIITGEIFTASSLSSCAEVKVTEFKGFRERGYTAAFSIIPPESEILCGFTLTAEGFTHPFSVFFAEPDAVLTLTKVYPAGTPDSVELFVTQSGTLRNTQLCVRDSCVGFPPVSVLISQKIKFYSSSGFSDFLITDGSETDVWEFYGGKSMNATDGVLTVRRNPALPPMDQDFTVYWSFWEGNPAGILDALVYANNNGSWTGCGATGNTSCLQELLDSGYWRIVRQDGDSYYWLESDAVLSDGRTLMSGDSFSRKVLQSSKNALNPSQDWEFLFFL